MRWKVNWRVPGKRRRVGTGGTAFWKFPPEHVRELGSLTKMGVGLQSKAAGVIPCTRNCPQRGVQGRAAGSEEPEPLQADGSGEAAGKVCMGVWRGV